MDRIEYGYEAGELKNYLEQYIEEHQMQQSKAALPYAVEKHSGQKRSEGLPYIIHPLMMACHAIAVGVAEDTLVAVILLHDVCEDCGVSPKELPVNAIVQEGVALLTNVRRPEESKEEAMERYIRQVSRSSTACLVKLFDRCHNISTMSRGFSPQRRSAYIRETKVHIYPLIEYAKETYPEYASVVFLLEYQMKSVVETIEACEKHFIT